VLGAGQLPGRHGTCSALDAAIFCPGEVFLIFSTSSSASLGLHTVFLTFSFSFFIAQSYFGDYKYMSGLQVGLFFLGM